MRAQSTTIFITAGIKNSKESKIHTRVAASEGKGWLRTNVLPIYAGM